MADSVIDIPRSKTAKDNTLVEPDTEHDNATASTPLLAEEEAMERTRRVGNADANSQRRKLRRSGTGNSRRSQNRNGSNNNVEGHADGRARLVTVLMAVLICTFFIAVVYSVFLIIPHYKTKFSSRGKLVVGINGAVSSDHPDCSKIGVDILQKGGSAVDSSIAIALCIGVVHSFSSGIGGGGFMVIRDSETSKGHFIDFREAAPKESKYDMFTSDPMLAQIGALSVAVPGEIRGFEMAHKRFGKLDWNQLFEPSINLARNGWKIDKPLAQKLEYFEQKILSNTEFKSVFAPNGTILREGEICYRQKLADTLELIGKNGADEFYTGSVGKAIVKHLSEKGGILTNQDFKHYEAKMSPAIEGFYRGQRIWASGLPTSGNVLLSILNILEGFNLEMHGITADTLHWMIEAFKFGYSQRSYYGDPDNEPVFKNISDIANKFSNKHMASLLRGKISDTRTFGPDYYNMDFISENLEFIGKEDHGTTHLSVLTSDNNAVSLTSTINLPFGSWVMEPLTGIILNDEMDDFSIPNVPNFFGLMPSPYNYVRPFKRPLSSSVPVIVEHNGEVRLVVGSAGGSRIISATIQTLLNVIDFNLNVLEAISFPRIHHQLVPNKIMAEYEYHDEGLASKGHIIDKLPHGLYLTGVSAVAKRLSDGVLEAASDWRKGGISAGY